MSDITTKTEGDRIGWESSNPIWASYSGNPPCHLCKENPGELYRKGHTRRHGVHLEASVMYCKTCNRDRQEEVNEDFEKWWAEKWAKCEARAEENWQEHGIYTNVGSSDGPSTYFGYVKLDDGTFRPYRYDHPENERDILERDMHDEHDRIAVLEMSDREKFDEYLKFLRNYLQNDQNKHQLQSEIKKVEEYLGNLGD